MFLIIFLLFLILFFISKRKKASNMQKKARAEGDRLHLILQNVEAYDGSGKGQKRLEDIK